MASPRRALPPSDDLLEGVVRDESFDDAEQTMILPRRSVENLDAASASAWVVEEHDDAPAPTPRRAAAAPAEPGQAAPDQTAPGLGRLVDSVPPPPSRTARDKQPVLPHGVPAPRRSATSPSMWTSPDEAVAPRRSATSPSLIPTPRRSAVSPSRLDGDPVPRRSATSPSEPDALAAGRPTTPPVGTSSASPADGAAVVEAPARRSWPWLVLAVLLALALVLAWVLLRPKGQPDRPGTSPVPPRIAFVAPEQLAALGQGWQVTQDLHTLDEGSPTAKCMTGAAPRLRRADASSLRLLGATDGGTMLHRIDTYPSADEARDAYQARLAQLATCDALVQITGAHTVINLGDDATILDVAAQETQPVAHTILLLRVGRGVEVLDLGQPGTKPAPLLLARAAQPVVGAHCEPLAGSCTADAILTDTPPPPGGETGFLLPADLPRVTPGVGRWVGIEPQAKVDMVGNQCENVALGEITGKRRFQRTLLLTDDPTAGTAFGVDELLVELGSPPEAEDLAKKLVDNINGCPGRLSTAAVDRVAPVTGKTDNGTLSGTVLRVTQRPAGAAAIYRSAVVVTGARLAYLVETPKDPYDLSDEQWAAIAVRAGQRAAQWN